MLRLLGHHLRARLCAIRERELNVGRVRDDVQAREDVAAIVNNDTAPQTMICLAVRAGVLRLDENERGLYHLVYARRKGWWGCGSREGLGDYVIHLTRSQLMWSGNENIVKQERHEHG